jgi:single-stranded-DNA-specific exonuclease
MNLMFVGAEKKKWILYKSTGDDLIKSLKQQRNIIEETSTFDEAVKESMTIFGMEKAIRLTVDSIKNNLKIGLIGDYDVDGTTSVAIFTLFFKSIGIETFFIIPNRFSDGYGPSREIFTGMKKNNIDIVFIMDCGSTSIKEIAFANEIGIKTIVIDHHFVEEKDLPLVSAIINPQVNKHPFSILCSAGLSFIFLWNLRIHLVKEGIINLNKREMIKYIDLVSLGTVCDVVPLVGINRLIVKIGLTVANMEGSILRRFADYLHKDGKIKIEEGFYGFQMGPRINSLGRFGCGEIAVYSMINPEISLQCICYMDLLNLKRRSIEASITKLVETNILSQKNLYETNDFIVTWGDSNDFFFSPVLGIIAGKIKSAKSKSVFIISWMGDKGKGSARSVNSLHIGNAMRDAKNQKIVIDGGGHLNAGGFTLKKDQLERFCKVLEENVSHNIICEKDVIDGILSLSCVNKELVDSLKNIGPFGQHNPLPVFLFTNIRIIRYSITDGGIYFCTMANLVDNRVCVKGQCMISIKNIIFTEGILNRSVNIVANVVEYNKIVRCNILDIVVAE